MIIARDKAKSKTEYKGHPCYVVDSMCVCRSCFNCHDCTPPNPAYSKKVYSDVFHCATNWNSGCPYVNYKLIEPIHDLNKQHRCKKCGTKVG